MINYGLNHIPNGLTAVALGTFDGIHTGHFDVINFAVISAKKNGYIPCVISFYPHPQEILSGKAPYALMTPSERETVQTLMGVELCYMLDFCEIRNLSPRQFVKDILYDKLKVRSISCGYDYRFGEKGAGNAEILKSLCDEFKIELHVTEPVLCRGERVSSTRIRKEIENGNIALANEMLGRPFCYDFIVVGGLKNGRTIGFPTINQYFPEGFIMPKFGVYASRTFVDGWWKPSVTNFGVRPTVGSDRPISETCILDYSGDLYGENVRVELLEYIREEKKFSSLEALKEQIKIDSEKARLRSEIKAVLFDFDDTLSDRRTGFMEFAKYFLKKYFPDMSELEIGMRSEEMNINNNGGYCDRSKFFSDIVKNYGMKNPPDEEVFFQEYDTVFPRYVRLFENTKDTLKALRSMGLKTGIITNGVSKMQHNKIKNTGIDDLIDVFSVSGDYDFKKPDKRVFDVTLQKLGLRSEQAVFVGDHPINDIRGAKGAGLNAVFMQHGFFDKTVIPDTVTIRDIGQIVEIIRKNNKK